MKKIIKLSASILLAFIMMVASIINVKAAPNSISIGQAYKVGHNYINNVTFSYKVTTDGRYLYCLDLHRNTASNVEATLVQNSSYVDGGILYILKNGYPEKSITGDNDKDYYITQTAVWWYLDETHGMKNLGNGFKNTGKDSYGLREYVRNLVNEGIAHKDDPNDDTPAALTIGAASESMTLDNEGYYISSDIKATQYTAISEYTVTIDNPVNGMMIIPSNGNQFAYSQAFTMGLNDSFKIKIPASSVTTDTTINITADANGVNTYKAYEYQPTNTKMQNVVLLEKTPSTAKATIKQTISPTGLSITKVDSKTKKPVAGATLVLKNEAGKELARWTTTLNAHVIKNLLPGTYTVEEVKAPEGYVLNTKPVTVKITKDKKNYTVSMENTPKNIVININKIDKDTNKPLAGATLVIKDKNGKEVLRFVTTEEPLVITDITYGTYTIEEESAPEGYIKSNEKITFTVDDLHQSHQITITNSKPTPVPNTGTESLFLLIGAIILGIGLDFILKHAKA